MTTLTDLLMRDPEHPEVRALLELRYRQVCAEQQLLARVLHINAKNRNKVAMMRYDESQGRWIGIQKWNEQG